MVSVKDFLMKKNQLKGKNSSFICTRVSPPSFLGMSLNVLFLCSLLMVFFAGGPCCAGTPANVLLLNSYHQGYRWGDEITSGIRETILKAAPHTQLYVEYLDSKRFVSPVALERLADLIAEKYREMRLSVVIAADNNALSFLKEQKEALFPGVPIVVCGINYLDPDDLQGLGGITGINEAADVEETIDLALRLLPSTSKIMIVNDTTLTGRRVHEEIEQSVGKYVGRVAFSFMEDLPREDLLAQLSALEPGTVVLYTFFFRDSKGQFYEFDDSADHVARASSVPVFGLWDFNLGYGMVGGKLVSGSEQGLAAGGMALRILGGEKVTDIAPQMKSPNRFSFDFAALKRFKIDPAELPESSRIINKPISIYNEYRLFIWGAGFVLLALSLLSLFLMNAIRLRRRVEKRLRNSEQQMSQIIDFLPDATFVIDLAGRVIAWNRAMEELTGVQASAMLGKGDFEYALPFYGERRPIIVDMILNGDETILGKYNKILRQGNRIISENQTEYKIFGQRYLRGTAGPLCDGQGNVVGAIEIIHDISQSRNAEIALEQQYAEVKRNLAFIEAMLSAIPSAVFYQDADACVLGCNRAFEEILGMSQQELIGKSIYAFWPKEQGELNRQKDRELKENPGRQEYEFTLVDRMGKERVVLVARDIFRDHLGRFAGIMSAFMDISERRRMEENLRMMEHVVRHSPAVLFRWQAEEGWPVVFVSENVSLFGYTPEILQSGVVHFADLVHAEDRERLAHELTTFTDQGVNSFSQEYRLVDAEGQIHWVDDRTFVERDEHGTVTHYQGIILDISKRKQMEKELLEANRMLRLILDIIPVRVFWKDRQCVYLGCNRPFAQDAGLKEPSELVGKDDFTLPWARSQAEMYRADDQRIMATGHSRINFEETQTTSEGKVIWLETSKAPIHDEDGSVIGVLGTYAEITQRKAAEDELRRLRNYLSNVINSMPSVLIGVDLDGRVIQWNMQAEQETGLSFAKAWTQPLEKVFPQLMIEVERIKHAIKEQRVFTDSKRQRVREGETRFEDITIFPLVTNGIEGAVIRVDDVTERVRLEEMMIQSEKMLSVGGLAAGMAHEINNPLAGILQNTEVLTNRLYGDIPANHAAAKAAGISMAEIGRYLELRKLGDMLENIRSSGNRAATIVKNMLSFARKSEHTTSSHDLCQLLDQTVGLAQSDYDMKKHYDFKNIEIFREYDANLPPVPCEGSKLQQVFLNLLKNGAEAMATDLKRGQPKFILRIKEEDEWIRVEIEDNGPGMDASTQRRVFEPFFTTKPIGQGTGLGLSVSYFIITEHHRGKMVVELVESGGTRFIIHLPKRR